MWLLVRVRRTNARRIYMWPCIHLLFVVRICVCAVAFYLCVCVFVCMCEREFCVHVCIYMLPTSGVDRDLRAVSCVRASEDSRVGFVNDVRRMIVALTRARFSCWVVGSHAALRRSPHGAAFVDSVIRRGLVRDAREMIHIH